MLAKHDHVNLLLQRELGDQWQLFLVEDKEEKPTAVVLPSSAREGELSRFTEVGVAAAVRLRVCAVCGCVHLRLCA